MAMPVMKEAGAQWLTALYEKLCSENSIVINGFKKVGIMEAVQTTRDGTLSEEDSEDLLSTDPMLDEDPFDSFTDTEES